MQDIDKAIFPYACAKNDRAYLLFQLSAANWKSILDRLNQGS